MKNISIEKPTLADVHTMVRWGKLAPELHYNEKGEFYTQLDLQGWIKNPKGHLLRVAKIKGALVGMCFTFFLHGWAYCDILYVDSPHRGKGIGKKLLSHSMDQAKRRGLHMYILLVNTQNEQAQKFYKKVRFYKGYSFFAMEKRL